MASSGRNRGANHGYRSWFPPYRYNQQVDQPIFILDYEAKSKKDETFEPSFDSEDDYQSGGNTRTINGVQVYFLDEGHNKRSAFLRHAPYFYLLIRSELTSNQINRIIAQIQELGEKKVIMVSKEICHDAADLTFLITKDFLKVTVDHPRSVPSIRSQCEQIKGVIEWREADVLYNHRVAIDHNIRVGSWYQADIRGGEIHKLDILHNKAPPELQILAYDIETVFDLTREPNPNRDAISMISLFTGNVNHLIINDDVVDTKDVSGIDIVLKQKDKDHSKPWVDWCKKDTFFPQSVLIERVPVNVQIYKNEQQLLHRFYEIIEEYQPDVFADFFGDRFDIPFLAVRSLLYNISLERRTGFRIKYKRRPDGQNQGNIDLRENYSPASIDSVSGAGIIHLDAYLFNEKYSYLPKKDLGLKPSVEKKLKIIPIGREALFAIEESPVDAVGYAACDGYITYRYVKEIVLDFFISLGQMFPVPSSEILTRRAGSLDDLLIDAEGHHYNIIGKRRIEQKHIESFSPNIRIDSFAYTGGLVEARRSGIFRSDIFTDFKPNKKALTEIKALIQQIITKNSEGIAKREMKNQFDRKILAKFGDLPISFTDDLEQLHKNFSSALQQNGVPTSLYEEKNSILREILEDLYDIQVEGVEQVVEEIVKQIDELLDTSGPVQMRGVHVDVTSMYPSQIRQYKLQPSGIVPLTKCQKCNYKEKDGSCFFEGDWVIKLTARRPCKHKVKSSSKCDPSICTTQNESTCKEYEPEEATTGRIQEIFSYNGSQTEAHILKKRSGFTKIPLSKSYLGKNFTSVDPYNRIEKWLEQTVEATQLGTHLDRNHFDIFEDQPKSFQLPKNTYLSIDVRTKKISVLISVQSRVCQKAFNFVARIMDEFFNTRVRHKFEAQRLKQVIKQKNLKNQSVPPTTLRQQKFHDSTQLGMKVPLNSIYGLLGMRGGVRNASTPCAGITTKLSADLIYWAANQLENIGMVTELDTDGVWLWVPKQFPLDFPVTLSNPAELDEKLKFRVSLIDKILNEKVFTAGFKNDNYQLNDGVTIKRTSKSLIQFEQDGPYDFQFVMGKKKYIVYNHLGQDNKWEEEEITGLESKRADFSKLQKHFQEEIIKAYLEQYDPANPISLGQIYQNAFKASDRIRNEVLEGNLDPSYFVKPKAINKDLKDYKSKLPQVTAAYILKDLGYSIDPGIRIQMVNIKGNHVIPAQVFDFDFEKVKSVFIKHGICTLSFMLNEITSISDIKQLIDTKQYLKDIYDPGRIFDRMIQYPMKTQEVKSDTQNILDIEEIENAEKEKILEQESEDVNSAIIKSSEPEEETPPLRLVKLSTNVNLKKTQKKRGKPRTQSLDTIFNFPKTTKSQPKRRRKKGSKRSSSSVKPSSMKSVSPQISRNEIESIIPKSVETTSRDQKSSLVSPDEIDELEKTDLYTNGEKGEEETSITQEESTSDEEIVCSKCGAFITLTEFNEEGCVYCHDPTLTE
ncbi:MAG: 3'-5' exonuclease [Candidatus Hodarchaeales archaeon]|jgi:DNA polymerase elongation subunit (family B)